MIAAQYHRLTAHRLAPITGARLHEPSAHLGFVNEHCTEHVTKALTAQGLPLAATRHLYARGMAFVGVTELFAESLCVFLYQAGRDIS